MNTPNPIRSLLALGVVSLGVSTSTLIVHADQEGTKPFKSISEAVYSEIVAKAVIAGPFDSQNAYSAVAEDGTLVDKDGQAILPGPDAKARGAFTNPAAANAFLESERARYANAGLLWLEYNDSYSEWEIWSNFGGHGTAIVLQANFFSWITGKLEWSQWSECTWADGSVTWAASSGTAGFSGIAGTVTVVGGTGRLTDATGDGVVTGYRNATGASVAEVSGRISTVGSTKR